MPRAIAPRVPGGQGPEAVPSSGHRACSRQGSMLRPAQPLEHAGTVFRAWQSIPDSRRRSATISVWRVRPSCQVTSD